MFDGRLDPEARIPQPPGAEPTAIDPAHIEGRVDRSLLTRVRRLVERYPEESLKVVRGWMDGGGWSR